MINNSLFKLKDALTDIINQNYTCEYIQFSLGIIRNKRIIENTIADWKEAVKSSDEFNEYDSKRIDLLKECSTNSDGKIESRELGNGQVEYLIQEDYKDEFQSKIKILQDEYSKAIEEDIQKQSNFNKFLLEKVDPEAVQFFKIKADVIPLDIKTSHLEAIYDLLEDAN